MRSREVKPFAEHTRAVVRGSRAVLVLVLPDGFGALALDEQRRLIEREAEKAVELAKQDAERHHLQREMPFSYAERVSADEWDAA